MRVLFAPSWFAPALPSPAVADALAAGWRRSAPADDLRVAPLADGGAGFVPALAAAPGGSLRESVVTGPDGADLRVPWLLDGGTGYLSAAAVTGTGPGDPARAGSAGVGALLAAAASAGAGELVLAVDGVGSHDGGAGLLADLGLEPAGPLRAGLAAAAALPAVDASGLRVPAGRLAFASSARMPLLGLRGASALEAPARGAGPDAVQRLDADLTRWRDLLVRAWPPAAVRRLAERPGAGAGGGLGFVLLALGAEQVDPVRLVAERAGLAEAVAGVDLVVTGRSRLDWSAPADPVLRLVIDAAAAEAVPCVAVGLGVELGRRELAAAGLAGAYAVPAGDGDDTARLAAAAARMAVTWSRR